MAMAEHIAGTEEAFVEIMNAKAKELGMNDTTFKNCHGFDEEGHVTSTYDIALMSRKLLNKYPEITKYTTIYMDSLRNGESELVNTNKLIRTYEGCTVLKTGSTSQALYNLSASANRDGLSLITKGQGANISQTVNLYDSVQAPITEGEVLGKVIYNIGDDKLLEVNLIAKEEVKKIDIITMTCKIYEKWFNLLR